MKSLLLKNVPRDVQREKKKQVKLLIKKSVDGIEICGKFKENRKVSYNNRVIKRDMEPGK